MIQPLNFTSSGIKPVPKPPKAVSFTGIGRMASEIAETAKFAGFKSAAKIYAAEAAEWLKKPKIGPKVKDLFGTVVNKVKALNIPGRVHLFLETVKNSGIVKKATEFISKLVKKA